MSVVSMKQLLEAGVHFGHQTRRWNPKMAEYIFTERNGIYIIDLQKTVKKLNDAYMYVRDIAADGGDILFVGTKKQAQEAIKEEAERCSMPYVNARWLGGMLTNFRTIRLRINRLAQLRKMEEDGTFDLLPKKEVIKLNLEIEKLEKFLGGIKDMDKVPAAMFIVDPRKERIAVMEAKKLNIPIIAIVDTNCDPDEIDAVIPGNDDAIRAVKLIAGAMASAVIEGKQGEQVNPEDGEDDDIQVITEEDFEEKPVKKPRAKKAAAEEKPEEKVEEKAEEKAEEKVEEKVEEKAEEKPAKKTTAAKKPAAKKTTTAKKTVKKDEEKAETEEKPAKKTAAKTTTAKKTTAKKTVKKAEEEAAE